MTNQKIPTLPGAIILVIIAVTVFSFVWVYERGQETAREEQTQKKEAENKAADFEQISPEKMTKVRDVFSDAWTAEAHGFLTIKNEANPYEESQRYNVAYFTVENTESLELSEYFGGDSLIIIKLGCIGGSKITYNTYSDKKSGEIEGTAFQYLKKSRKDNPVTLTLEKPFYSLDWGGEGANCWTEFKNFQVE